MNQPLPMDKDVYPFSMIFNPFSIFHISSTFFSDGSSIARPVLTQELRGGCGAGKGYFGVRGMTSRGEGESI